MLAREMKCFQVAGWMAGGLISFPWRVDDLERRGRLLYASGAEVDDLMTFFLLKDQKLEKNHKWGGE